MSKFKLSFSISGILLGILIFITNSIHASFFTTSTETKTSSLLNGRLSIQAPSTSWRDELTIDLMSEKNLFKDQTVLDYSKNSKGLRIVATELFAWRTDNLQGNLAKFISNYPQKIGLSYKISQIDRNRYELVPSKLIQIKGIALVRSLFFVNTDDTIQSIDIYMDTNAVKNPLKAVALAKKLLKTVKPGKKKLRKGPRTVLLGSQKKPRYFKIRLPKGYVISSKKQDNARVHIIRKLVPLGNSQTSLAIYIGNEPSPYQAKFGEYDTSRDAANGRLLDQIIHWRTLKKAASIRRRMVKASALLPWSKNNPRGEQYYIHIFADSETVKGMNKMVSLAGKLQYVKKPRYSITAIDQTQYQKQDYQSEPSDNVVTTKPTAPKNYSHNRDTNTDSTYKKPRKETRLNDQRYSRNKQNKRYDPSRRRYRSPRYEDGYYEDTAPRRPRSWSYSDENPVYSDRQQDPDYRYGNEHDNYYSNRNDHDYDHGDSYNDTF